MANDTIKLDGRVFIEFNVVTASGLHIGGSEAGIEIGGVDKTVIRDGNSGQPYIPGSSLRGKMRSLTEKYLGLRQNQRIGQGYIHSCGAEKDPNGKAEYLKCPVCQVYGVPGERDFSTPTRLIVRDISMTEESAKKLDEANTDLPYTEVKTEVSIDRVTSAANPRQLERVPAGVEFGPAEMVYSIYSGAGCTPEKDIERLAIVFDGMQFLEDDYLGGSGSRGSGKIKFSQIKVGIKASNDYPAEPEWLDEDKYPSLPDLIRDKAHLLQQIKTKLLAQ